MDKLERAGRILARAFGCGDVWNPDREFGKRCDWRQEKDTTPSIRLGGVIRREMPESDESLSILRETTTVERARDSVTAWLGNENALPQQLTREQRIARAKYTPEQLAEMWEWEARNPLTAGVRRTSANKPRELEKWASERIPWKRNYVGGVATAIYPKVSPCEQALIALAGLPKPLQSILLMYALERGEHWPIIETCARSVLPASAHRGIMEAMYRILRKSSDAERARRYHMRRSDYVAAVRPAHALLEQWLRHAADSFAGRFEIAKAMLECHIHTVK